MNIWFVETGEPLPTEGAARLHRYGLFTKWLANNGHEVTWWTSSFLHQRKQNFYIEDITHSLRPNFRLKIIHGKGYQRNVSLARIRHNQDFAKKFYEQAGQLLRENLTTFSRPDIIIAPIPTIEAATVIAKLASLYGIPYVLDIRDEWPEELVKLAPWPLRPISKRLLFGQFEALAQAAANATAISGVSQRQVDYGLKYAGRVQERYDFVWPQTYEVNQNREAILARAAELIDKYSFQKESLKVFFCGTLGKFVDLKMPIQVIKELDSVELLIAGDGEGAMRLKRLAGTNPRIHFLGWLDALFIQAAMELSHVGLLPYRPRTAMASPNKLIEYLAGGLPLLSSIQERETREMIHNLSLGLQYDDKESFRDCLKHLSAPPNGQAYSENCRQTFDELYAMGALYPRIVKRLEKIIASVDRG